ncbi:DJ-1 family glyoxalase III [Thiosulfativibrio zosterae]|uniref:4-methyl-5(B-hydroxyethyl)-thiazole monophosphate biosynthesis protein n=1 Tax=Thiosulfativibrio zosterae TaxID=2675053 RepID=A0A6F8PQ57_9GAMM|nr:DJ-1 family glyoxalase III [Thiosulfativibrio zosterae]BBP44167.1 4-methyl-5(B-hydroxyethyl)-thiazole monophosphate biosynthesis protein [Thiosulfativibrio zosterae]
MQKRVLVPLAQGCEELEAVTIMDLLVRAGIEVVTASLDEQKIITASRHTQLIAQNTLAEVENQVFDLVVLPGGLPGADYLDQDMRLQRILQQTAAQGGWVGAVCAAPKVLVSAGLLDGKTATSYPGVIDTLPAKNMTYSHLPVVMDGKVVTSRGPGTVMDFALQLIEVLVGLEKRQTVEAALVR